MEVEISRNKNKIELRIDGEGHTFLNLLKDVLLEDEDVVVASYDVNHHKERGKLYIHASKPEDALERATSKIIERCNEFKRIFSKRL
jgi:DNA-directed RNA polymerase subunit L